MKISGIEFEWDKAKARKNIKKHGVSFEEAATVFADYYSSTVYDGEHSFLGEDRWVTLGKSNTGKHLIVVHCDREDKFRILTARCASGKQIKDYEEGK